MRLARTVMPAAFAAALLAASPAAAGSIEIGFAVYGSGIHLANGTFAIERGDGRYETRIEARGTRLVDLLTGWSYVAEAEGRLTAAGLAPETFRAERRLRRKHEVRRMRWDETGEVEVVDVPPQSAEDAAAVPAEFRPGTIDPLSALFAVATALGPDGCSGDLPVFDGRRRYDILARNDGTDTLEVSRLTRYSGPADRCEVTLRPVAGFEGDRDEGAFFEYGAERTATVWHAPAGPDGETVPVRLQLDGPGSSFVLHLVSATAGPGSATAQRASSDRM
jgi:hypothetical protein